eukprot:CAMPEP_0182466286 /NCGR_PEP_ID=MMETSP1319-20130603/11681_1 /TAXON_ID=172717 /ORGANISM="Bolidomonas pacifica, Strain RCC208" /LENGTH=397 /DNA_ID=CAMNT_0024666249 /DNA_START=46 /DNA_END=1236 /DNA_ORIENTATION=+
MTSPAASKKTLLAVPLPSTIDELSGVCEELASMRLCQNPSCQSPVQRRMVLIGEEGFCAKVECRAALEQWRVKLGRSRAASNGGASPVKKMTSLSQTKLPKPILKPPRVGKNTDSGATSAAPESTYVPRRPKLRSPPPPSAVKTKSDIQALVAATRKGMEEAGVKPGKAMGDVGSLPPKPPKPPKEVKRVKGPSITVPDIKERVVEPVKAELGEVKSTKVGKAGKDDDQDVITADLDFDVVAGGGGEREEQDEEEQEQEDNSDDDDDAAPHSLDYDAAQALDSTNFMRSPFSDSSSSDSEEEVACPTRYPSNFTLFQLTHSLLLLVLTPRTCPALLSFSTASTAPAPAAALVNPQRRAGTARLAELGLHVIKPRDPASARRAIECFLGTLDYSQPIK